jgi:hypothetical protein
LFWLRNLWFIWTKNSINDNNYIVRGGGYGYLFRSEFFFWTTRELEFIFFPEFNIRLYNKNSESDYYFFPPPKSEYFFSNIGNQNIFLEKKHNPPLEVKWSVPYDMYSKCHSMYLKWTYFCNHHMGTISHWESCRQNI